MDVIPVAQMIVTGKMAPDSIDRVRDDNLELPSTLGISIPQTTASSVSELVKMPAMLI